MDIQQYKQRLRDLVPFDSLGPALQDELIGGGEILEFGEGRYVFREGDTDDYNYYLLAGELEMSAHGTVANRYVGGSDTCRYPLAQLRPRKFSARVARPAVVFRVDRHLVDELKQRHAAETGAVEVEEAGAAGGDWMTSMLQSELFSRIPATNLQRLFAVVDYIEVQVGQEIITQGDPGDYYYIIHHGTCDVLVEPKSGGKQVKVATLKDNDSFGEEALVTDAPRNATIRMTSHGHLLRLGKQDFQALIRDVLLESVSYETAEKMVAEGARWLDVRFAEDHERLAIPGSLNIPFNVLRLRAEDLDPDARYITYCNNGLRSSVAAFLLIQRGFDVRFLDHGLENSPLAGRFSPGAEEAEAGAPAPAADAPQPNREQKDEAAARLRAELARAREQLEQALAHKRDADAARRVFEKRVEQKFQLAKQRIREEMTKAARAREEAARLGKELAAARSEAAEGDKLRQLAEDHDKQLEAQRAELESQHEDELKGARAEWKEREAHLTQELESLRGELDHRREELARAREQGDASLAALQGEADEAARERDRLADRMNELTSELENVKASSAQAQAGLEALGRERDEAREAAAVAQEEVTRLREELERLEGRAADGEGEVARVGAERDEAMARVGALEEELAGVREELEGRLAALDGEKSALAAELDGARQRVAALEAERDGVRGELEQSREAGAAKEAMAGELEEARGRAAALEAERDELTARVAELEEDVAAARVGGADEAGAARERAERAEDELARARAAWEEEREGMREQLAEAESALEEFDQLREEMQSGRRVVEEAAERQEQELGALEQTLREEAKAELSRERERLEQEFAERLEGARREWQRDMGVDTAGDVAAFMAGDDRGAELERELTQTRQELERMRDALRAVEKSRDEAVERLRQSRQAAPEVAAADDENRLVDPAKIRELMERRRELLKRQTKDKG